MELYDVMRTTFSARTFTGEEISDETLFEILDNARFAPSGGNRQGNRVIVVRDADTREALSRCAIQAAKRYAAQVAAGENPWNSVVPSAVSQQTIDAMEPPPGLMDSVITASVVLVFLVDLRVVASIDQHLDRIGVVSGASIYPFVWNVLLGARQAGFGGTLTTIAIAEEAAVQTLLNIPPHFAVAAVVPIGKPVKQLTRLKRHPVSRIATRETFDGARFAPE